jgi:hypothetical protein
MKDNKMINELITKLIIFLLKRFSFDFNEEQRYRINEVLTENQSI